MNVRTKKILLLSLSFLLVCVPVITMVPDVVFAQDTGAAPTAGDKPVALSTFEEMMATLMNFFMSAAALLTWLGGVTLNAGMYYGVVKMADFVNGLGAINLAWGVLRDVGNIVLIFALLAVGISTIIGAQSYGAKTLLPKVILVAIVLNFSLFITKVVIDSGNIIATQFYKEIVGGEIHPPFGGASESGDAGMSGRLMQDLNLTTLYNPALGAGNENKSQMITMSGIIMVGIIGVIFFLITAFVFFALGFMIISRFVILVFLMIISPLAFVAQAVPYLQSQWKKWLETLISQTFFAPAVMLLLLISFNITRDIKNVLGSPAVSQLASAGNESAQIALSFLIAIGFMVASMLVAKQMSAFGGSMAQRLAGKATAGTLGFMGRNTVGWGSARVRDAITEGKFGEKLRSSETGRRISQFADKGARASYDARASSNIKGLEKVGISMGAGAGKGGYSGGVEALVKERTKYEESLTQTGAEKDIEKGLKVERATLEAERDTEARVAEEGIKTKEREAARSYATEKEKLDKKRNDAVAKGDTALATQAQKELGELEKNHKEKLTLITAEREAVRTRKEQFDKEKVEPVNEKILKQQPGIQYADSMTSRTDNERTGARAGVVAGATSGGVAFGPAGAVVGGAVGGVVGLAYGINAYLKPNKDAAEKIREKHKKKEKDKDRDALIKAAREGAKEGAKKDDE